MLCVIYCTCMRSIKGISNDSTSRSCASTETTVALRYMITLTTRKDLGNVNKTQLKVLGGSN